MKKTTDSFGRQIQIGNVVLENNVFLAPMAGVTDLPFRLICKEQGAGLLCMEMISAKAVHYNNKNTEALMEIHPDELPVSLQLFGSEPDIMAETAARISERPFAILDINMGCPVPKVVNNREGSALMKNPRLAGEIIHAVAKAVSKPVTVKIRKGFDDNSVNAVELAKIAEANGAAAVAVHGRKRAVLCGNGGLGHYPAGKGGGQHSCYRKWRCHGRIGGGKNVGGNRMRRCYGGQGKPWKPVDFQGN